MLERGAVYSFSYLWAREADAGEESGRKNRPVCLLVRPSRQPDLMYLFAITSQEPTKHRVAEKLSSAECKRCGLREPAWLVLDEYNIAIDSELHDFTSPNPLGTFSPNYLKHLLKIAIEAAVTGRSRAILRS